MRRHRPWQQHRSWDHDSWPHVSRRRRGRLFLRFIAVFGFIVLLVLGGMAVLALLLTRLFGGDGHTAVLVWIGGCGLSLALPLLALTLAGRAFRRITTPLADIMAAADAVAEGDLAVRVAETGPSEFGQLARSFNRMTEELAWADQRRRNLTADVAHELRTPLHIIQGNLEGIVDGVYEPTDDHINAILEETRSLGRLVEDLQTLSLAEAGQLPIVREPVELAELLADVQTSFSGQAEAAGIELRIERVAAAPDAPAAALPIISGDVGRLNQVLSNLVANAIRHTPHGGSVTLRAEPAVGAVRIAVQDTGQGIAAEDLPFIFDRFWKGDRARSAGAGLGLAIARQLVQAHGGQITAASQVGQGTTITIELPVDAA